MEESNYTSWKKMLLSALIGALLTGLTQYFILNANFTNELEKARIQSKRELLTQELNKRKKAYLEIRNTVEEFFLSKENKEVEEFERKIRSNIPFFSSRNNSQLTVESRINLTLEAIRIHNKKEAQAVLSDLEDAFQNDIDRIENDILSK
nr:hypothetical protein [uncultured Amphritea sp.]